jgi:hypothetical protein
MSLWRKGSIPGQQRRFALGLWLPERKLSSPAYVPAPKARVGLRYKRPIWYVVNLSILSQQTSYARISVGKNFRLMAIMGSGSAGSPADGNGSFQFQVFDNARRTPFSELPILSPVGVGTASNPFILKNPYRFADTSPVQVRVQNRASTTNNIYIALYGVSD